MDTGRRHSNVGGTESGGTARSMVTAQHRKRRHSIVHGDSTARSVVTAQHRKRRHSIVHGDGTARSVVRVF